MKRFITTYFLFYSLVQSLFAQNITSQELSKLSKEINALQTAADGKVLYDAEKNTTATLSFPPESFQAYFSSGFAFQAVYKNSGADQLFVAENVDLSVANKVTILPGNSKSSAHTIRVSFPETVVTHVLEDGKEVSTIYENALDFYCAADNPENKNKLKKLLETLIAKLAKDYDKYHTLKNGKLYLADGIYEGNYTTGNRRASKGTMEYYDEPLHNGEWIYKGGWKNDRRHFEGTLTSKPGNKAESGSTNNATPIEIYSGKWENDVLQGKGKYEKVGEWKYEGYFTNGRMDGEGTSIDKDGRKYVGQWKNGLKEGKGLLTTSNGYKYEGEWKNNKLNGEGYWVNASGDFKYVGNFLNDREDGIGTLTYGAAIYTGEWDRGKESGKGVMLYENGDKYDGKWKQGFKEGKGIMMYANGDKYDGTWYIDKKSLQGTYTWSNGDTYSGEWSEDTMHNQGTMIYANGGKYVGEWKKGKPWGIGTFYDKNNNKIKDIGLNRPILTNTYLKKETKFLNRDKTYFINYVLTDSTLVLYLPKNMTFNLYFDMQNDKEITPDIDPNYYYSKDLNSIQQFFIKKSSGYFGVYHELPEQRDANNILELTFQLKNVVNLKRYVGNGNPKAIAFQVYFSTDSYEKILLPKRKEDVDFSEGKMYYIKPNQE